MERADYLTPLSYIVVTQALRETKRTVSNHAFVLSIIHIFFYNDEAPLCLDLSMSKNSCHDNFLFVVVIILLIHLCKIFKKPEEI